MKNIKKYSYSFPILVIIIIIAIIWVLFVLLFLYHPWDEIGNYIAIATSMAAFTGTLISIIASDKRTEKQLLNQEKNIIKQLRSDRKEEAYLTLIKEFYNEPLAVFDRGYTINRIKSELKDFLISRRNLCDFLLEFENENDGFFYIDKELMIDIITINQIVKYKQKHESFQKKYFIEFNKEISDIKELNELLKKDKIGIYLKTIKKKLEIYKKGNFPLVFVPIMGYD